MKTCKPRFANYLWQCTCSECVRVLW